MLNDAWKQTLEEGHLEELDEAMRSEIDHRPQAGEEVLQKVDREWELFMVEMGILRRQAYKTSQESLHQWSTDEESFSKEERQDFNREVLRIQDLLKKEINKGSSVEWCRTIKSGAGLMRRLSAQSTANLLEGSWI